MSRVCRTLHRRVSGQPCLRSSFFDGLSPEHARAAYREFQSETLVMRMHDRRHRDIQAHFIGGPWHGLYRTIPVEYVTPQAQLHASVDVKRVVDGSGRRSNSRQRVRHYRKLKIYVPDATTRPRKSRLNTRFSDALKFFDDHDELYWNVTATSGTFPSSPQRADFLAEGNQQHSRQRVYRAFRSRAQNADVEIAGNGVEVRTREPLHLHEGLTVAVAFDKALSASPPLRVSSRCFSAATGRWLFPSLPCSDVSPVVDARPRSATAADCAQYEPPDQLTPGSGHARDNSADMRDITAPSSILRCAGTSSSKSIRGRMLGLVHDKDYNFIVQKESSEWSKLKLTSKLAGGHLFSWTIETDSPRFQ